MKEKRCLFLVETVRCGNFYVIASHFTDASEKVRILLDKADYDFSHYRKVISIKLITEEIYDYSNNGKPSMTKDRKLII